TVGEIGTDMNGLFGINTQNVLDGFVVKGEEIPLYGSSTYLVDQPLVRATGVQAQPPATAGEVVGFAAGFVATLNPSAPSAGYTSYNVVANEWNPTGNLYGVSFTKHANGTLGGNIKLGRVDAENSTITNYGASS